jgi:hypothetical protein
MRLMDDVLRHFTNSFVVVYLDDILIFNITWEEHMWHSGFENFAIVQAICQLGKMFLWHEQGPILGIHC